MRTSPSVSVIIPTYNRAGIICQTIDNIFKQTYRNFELIIVDDGSTDDTQSKLGQYSDRIRVVRQNNSGPAAARNHGAKVARGEIIAFQDSDDLWKPTKLERQVALLEKDKSIPCCLCNVVLRVVDGRDYTSFDDSLIYPRHEEGIWLNVPEVLATRFVMFNQAVAIRRGAWEKLGGFDESLKYLEDYDLPLRLSLEGSWAFIREPLVMYRQGSPQSFSQAALKDPIVLKHCELKIIERILSNVEKTELSVTLQRYLKRRLRIFRRGMWEIEISRMSVWGAPTAARLVSTLGHYQDAVFRRSRRFPRMLTRPLAATDKMVSEVIQSSSNFDHLNSEINI